MVAVAKQRYCGNDWVGSAGAGSAGYGLGIQKRHVIYLRNVVLKA
jgi:hypothetical protein